MYVQFQGCHSVAILPFQHDDIRVFAVVRYSRSSQIEQTVGFTQRLVQTHKSQSTVHKLIALMVNNTSLVSGNVNTILATQNIAECRYNIKVKIQLVKTI